MNLSRARRKRGGIGSSSSSSSGKHNEGEFKSVEGYLEVRDFEGAAATCDFFGKVDGDKIDLGRILGKEMDEQYQAQGIELGELDGEEKREILRQWKAYSLYHGAEYGKAGKEYEVLLQNEECDLKYYLYLACCQIFQGMTLEAKKNAEKGPPSKLQTRVLFYISNNQHDEEGVMTYHARLEDQVEDQLCLASVHCLRLTYDTAIEVYKSILVENRGYLALSIAVAMAYFRQDQFDVSFEIVEAYLKEHPDSITGVNLKACALYHLKGKEEALGCVEGLLKSIGGIGKAQFGKEILEHNLVVFNDGKDALTVLKGLLDVIPVARLNLAIYYLKCEEVEEAFRLVEKMEAREPMEFIVKGVTMALKGLAEGGSDSALNQGKVHLDVVGFSDSQKDTIHGRQCAASAFILNKDWEQAYIHLESIQEWVVRDASFFYNFGVCAARLGKVEVALGCFKELGEGYVESDSSLQLLMVQCLVGAGDPQGAWDLFINSPTGPHSLEMGAVLANECYRMGFFYHSARAFDWLERLHPDPVYWEGKRGACIGVLQMVLAGKQGGEALNDVLQWLENSRQTEQYAIQAEYIIGEIQKLFE